MSSTTVGSLITRALRDGHVNAKEVASLIGKARKDSATFAIDPAEASQLKQLLAQHADAFDDDARTSLQSFLAAQPAAGSSTASEPGLVNDTEPETAYTSVTGGQLYVDGINYDDITQGEAGDCYYLSSIAAVAEDSPQTLQNAIKDNGDGTYTVSFYDKTKRGDAKPVNITVDAQLPTTANGDVYAASRNPSELWGPIMEKAFAQWKGGYEQIGQGGAAADALFALTGKATDYTEHVAKADPEKLWQNLSSATTNHQPMVTGTFDEGTRKDINWDKVGLFDGHDYTLLGVSEENGQRTVTLRDPHGGGDDEIKGGTYYSDNGTFKMPYADYLKYFDDLDILHP